MGMTKEDIIETMINTVNIYNTNLMLQSKMSQEEITKNIDSQYPALHYMFGLIYDDLESKNVFK
jgi:hypothetical protein